MRQRLDEPGRLVRFVLKSTDVVGQAATQHQFEHEKRPCVTLARLIYLDNVWMLQTGHDVRFDSEALTLPPVGEHTAPHDLHGDEARRRVLAGTIDDSHAATVNLVQQLESIDQREC